MFCPKCGTKLDDNARVCSTCGNLFEQAPVQPNDMQAFEPMNEIPAPTQPMQSFTNDVPPVHQPDTAPMQPVAQVKKKSHTALIAVLSVILVCAVAGSALFYFNPGGIFGESDDDDDSSSKKSKDSSSVSQVDDDSDDESSTDEDSSSDESSDSDSSEETTTTTTTATSEPDDTTTTSDTDASSDDSTDTTTASSDTETTTTSDQGGTADEDEDYKEAMKYSTNERPSFSDFEWCYGQLDLVRKRPTDSTQIKTANRMAGGWKCMFIYSTSKNSDMIAREVNNVIIDPTADEINMTIDWYMMEIPNSENVPEENMDDTVFPVTVGSNGALMGEPKGGKIVISEFWNDGKNDYAVGEYQTDSGLYAYVALYR